MGTQNKLEITVPNITEVIEWKDKADITWIEFRHAFTDDKEKRDKYGGTIILGKEDKLRNPKLVITRYDDMDLIVCLVQNQKSNKYIATIKLNNTREIGLGDSNPIHARVEFQDGSCIELF